MEVLQDGEWHDYVEVVREVAKVVPPGKALRKAEQLRLASARRPGEHLSYTAERRVVQRPTEQLIEYGAYAIVRAVLLASPSFEIEPRGKLTRDGPKRVRFTGKSVWRPADG